MAKAPAPPASHAGLARGISAARFQTFLDAAGQDEALARDLYVWNRDLSVAFLGDIAILEVALRNAMHDAATNAWGTHWYADIQVPLDERTLSQITSSWKHLHKSVTKRADDADVPGRLIAQCMFGVWTNLLDSGSYVGEGPRRRQIDYDDHWHAAFKSAFPGGKAEAKALRKATTSSLPNFTRDWVHGVCKAVNDLRNRVAHHEPLINGFPLNGQKARMSPAEGHEQCMLLARLIDRDLAKWLSSNSSVSSLLDGRPC